MNKSKNSNDKSQTNHKYQKSNHKRLTPQVLVIGNLDLEFVCNFGFEISLRVVF
jgi:hypothetical protein